MQKQDEFVTQSYRESVRGSKTIKYEVPPPQSQEDHIVINPRVSGQRDVTENPPWYHCLQVMALTRTRHRKTLISLKGGS